MIEVIRVVIGIASLLCVAIFGVLITRVSRRRLDIEQQNNRLLLALGVRLDSMHSRITRMEQRVYRPGPEAADHQG